MKKAIAYVLTGIMVLSLAACGKADTNSGEPVVIEEEQTEEGAAMTGGWTMADSHEVTDEIKDLFDKATEGITGAEYTPLVLIASQVVAGTNYSVLCGIRPVVRDAVTQYAIVTLYEDPEGGAQIVEIRTSEAEVEVLPDETLMGGWEAAESAEVTEEAGEALTKALEKIVGAEYEPVALLATQIVAGTNYSLLCKVTPVVPDAESDYVIVHVYQDLEGNAEITDTFEFAEAE